ncbi:MAG: RNA methyltransferase [Clostridia bacterium]|nr:RNA methyltransferase [Clostridia bacterium]
MIITSRKNPTIQWAYSLRDKKARDTEGVFFTEGKKLYDEGIMSGRVPVTAFVLKEYCNIKAGEVYEVSPEVYDKITDEKSPEGIFAVWKKPDFIGERKKSSVILLEELQDPGNMGTILRTAAAFGVREAVLVNCVDPYSPKAVRSSMGAVFKIPTTHFDSIDKAVEYSRKITDSVIATALHTDSNDISLTDTAYATIMIGNEGKGLSDRAVSLADSKAIIPMENTESLNASVAATIFMYDSMTKRKI